MPMHVTVVASGDPDVPVPVCHSPLARAQLGLLDRRHNRPVVSDWAALDSPPPEAKRLQRHARNPERPEQMTLPAANHQVATERIAAQPHGERLQKERGGNDQRAAAAWAHNPIVAKAGLAPLSEPSAAARRAGDPTSRPSRTTSRPTRPGSRSGSRLRSSRESRPRSRTCRTRGHRGRRPASA